MISKIQSDDIERLTKIQSSEMKLEEEKNSRMCLIQI